MSKLRQEIASGIFCLGIHAWNLIINTHFSVSGYWHKRNMHSLWLIITCHLVATIGCCGDRCWLYNAKHPSSFFQSLSLSSINSSWLKSLCYPISFCLQSIMSSSAPLKGYDHQFVEPAPGDLLCLICLSVAREPQQVSCCGKVICRGCLEEQKKHSDNCPQCRKIIASFSDKRSKCKSSYSNGCKASSTNSYCD